MMLLPCPTSCEGKNIMHVTTLHVAPSKDTYSDGMSSAGLRRLGMNKAYSWSGWWKSASGCVKEDFPLCCPDLSLPLGK